MSEPIWLHNLRDAILLEPLILVHGNVKDIFPLEQSKRRLLPESLSEQRYLSFDQWLALELEESGYPTVLIYDLVDGGVALRREMAERYSQMIRSSLNAQGQTSNQTGAVQAKTNEEAPPEERNPRTGSLPALPTQEVERSSSPENWMVKLEVQEAPDSFFRNLYRNVFPRTNDPVAVICRFTDRYLSYTDRQDNAERQLSLLIQKVAMSVPAIIEGNARGSRLIMLFDLEGSIPQELNVQSPFSRSVRIPEPSVAEREQFFQDNYAHFHSEPHERFDPNDSQDQLTELANLSEGLHMQDLCSLVTLSQQEQLGLGKQQFRSLLDRFRYGTRENAWLKIKNETLQNATMRLSTRVKGQQEVIEQVVPTLIRAKLGLSDLGNARQSTKPRGVFFFVGPTGVGKTELSKAIAELIFGDEKALVRFDMSEYSEEHQQARLIGAPPGYVGFDQGGQLTNTILDRPFSVILFDEIEKAHGRILDKFLQILDDGRLTDGTGKTVYFSEAIIIFTSNLGTAPGSLGPKSREELGAAVESQIVRRDTTADIYAQLENLDYESLCDHFRNSVKDFFVNSLGRPEILNRIGEDNILVFNFLKDDQAKKEIVEKQIEEVRAKVREQFRVQLEVTPSFITLLKTHPGGFERNGARGVRNLLSKLVVDQLAMEVFANRTEKEGQTFRVDYLVKEAQIPDTQFDRKRIEYRWNSP